MLKWMGGYFGLELIVVVAAVLATVWVRARRKHQRRQAPPLGFTRTNEVFTDPTTGVVFRVWFHPGTGERFYEKIDEQEPRG